MARCVTTIILVLCALHGRFGRTQWAIDSCPQPCRCEVSERADPEPSLTTTGVKTVDCNDQGLEIIPAIPPDAEMLVLDNNNFTDACTLLRNITWPNNLKEVDLRHNRIAKLEMCKQSHVQRLNLNDNEITILFLDNLFQLPKMAELSIQRNKISTVIPSKSISEWTQVSVLRLDYNEITCLDWLREGNALRTLNLLVLAGNVLDDSRLDANVFSRMPNLNALILSEMGISEIDQDAFAHLNELRTLDLDDNHLDNVPSDALTRLPKLRYLNLNGNKILQLYPYTFSNLAAVETIELTRQPALTLIDSKAFYNLTELQAVLLFSSPRLAYLAGDAFENCQSLETLDVHNTMIEILSPAMQEKLPALRKLYLRNNPVNCNCMMMWTKQWITGSSANVDTADDVVCASPSEYRGSKLFDVEIEEKICAPAVEPTFPIRATVKQGELLQLPCRSFGMPNPAIYWILPNGNLVHNMSEAIVHGMTLNEFGTLTSKNFMSGHYSCIAQNKRGMASRKILVSTISTTTEEPETTTEYATTPVLPLTTSTEEPHTTNGYATIPVLPLTSTKVVLNITMPEPNQSTTETMTKAPLHTSLTSTTTMTEAIAQQKIYEDVSKAALPLQSMHLTAPAVKILRVSTTSALVTWRFNNNFHYMKTLHEFMMSISLRHNERLIYNNLIQTYDMLPEWGADTPEYNISYLDPDQAYVICLTMKCCGSWENQSCTEVHTKKQADTDQANISIVISIIFCVFVMLLGVILAIFYGKPCNSSRWNHDQYQHLGFSNKRDHNFVIPLNELYAPLLNKHRKDEESAKGTQSLIDTSASTVYT